MNPIIKKICFRLLTAGLLCGTALFFDSLHSAALHRIAKPVTFTFSLPLPQSIRKKYRITTTPRVEKVIIAGNFSNWDCNNETFRMQETVNKQGKHIWRIRLHLQPGKTSYKFVAFTKERKRPYWVHDVHASSLEPDGIRGLNSVHYIDNRAGLYEDITHITLGLLGLILIYSLFEGLLSILLRKHVRTFHRLILQFSLLLVISNAGIIIFNTNQQKRITRLSYLESVNLIHVFLVSQGVDYSRIDAPDTKAKIRNTLHKFFWLIHAKVREPSYSGKELALHQIVVFGTNFKVLAYGDRRQDPVILPPKSIPEKYLKGLFNDWFFEELIEKIRKNPAKGLSAQFGTSKRCNCPVCRKKKIPFYDRAPILGYNTVLVPIHHRMNIKGYYGLVILPQLYAAEIEKSLWTNIIWSACLVLFLVIFFLVRPPNLGFSKKAFEEFCRKYRITKREQEIITHIARGTNYHKIGKALFISQKTVKAHVYNIYQKAEVSNRVELINRIRDSG